MSWPLTGWLVLGWVLITAQLLVVRTHSEPGAREPDAAGKPRYTDLVRPPAVVALLLLGAVCQLATCLVPPWQGASWVVWGSAGLVLVWVDQRTTWLPIRATRLLGLALALALLAGAALSGAPAAVGLRALLGGGSAGALFWVLWSTTGALGFGDVRLAALLGALTAAHSWPLWYTSLFAGSLAAAAWGLVTSLWRRTHPSRLGKVFAYGPGLWLGPYLALVTWPLLN